jgi:hypothetical protein
MEKIIAVYDLDGTLIDTDDKIKVKYPNEEIWKRLSGSEYESIRKTLPKGSQLNFDEFVGIPASARPIVKNLRIMDEHITNNHHIGILTARMDVSAIWAGLSHFLKYRSIKGEFINIPDQLFEKQHIFSADTLELRRVLDVNYSIANAKAYVLSEIFIGKMKFDKIYFYDDNETNIETVKQLNNHRIIATKVERD